MMKFSAIRYALACGLALSIGWGIRGNFGHEYGAAFAGCLACFVGAILSGREDWRQRAIHFAFFGMIGWGFGGSISYMQVISYTHSGVASTQLYGYTALFWIGFLWAGLGVAGVALAAAAERRFLDELIVPILFVFIAWMLQTPFEGWLERALATAAAEGADHTWNRHKSPLYWMDADYLAALFALLSMFAFDLWDRRGKGFVWIMVYSLVGAAIGGGLQFLLHMLSLDVPLARALTFTLGDPSAIDPVTKQPFGAANLLNNWPQWFLDFPNYIGVVIGGVAGLCVCFAQRGAFRRGSSLLAWMAAGWLCFFIVVPVLGSLVFQGIGGLRMTPPRSDDWAGITGVYLAVFIWFLRRGPRQVAWASLAGAAIGGLGFSGIACLKQLMMAPGNGERLAALVEQGAITQDVAQTTIADWANWQAQNWHSFLEQSYGFVNGLAVAVGLLLLLRRQPRHDDPMDAPGRPVAIMLFGLLIAITYVNIVKNVSNFAELKGAWIRTLEDGSTAPGLWRVPYIGNLPGMEAFALTPLGWFNLTWGLIALLFLGLAHGHGRRPLALVPSTWLGRGQLAFLALLWVMIIANWERAIPGFHPSRLMTEWVVYLNAIMVTWAVLIWPPSEETAPGLEPDWERLFGRVWRWSLSASVAGILLFFALTRIVYGDSFAGQSDLHLRFGEKASWRIKPILKQAPHR